MAGSKATKHPTKTDTLIRTVDQARQARGLNRHRIIPRVSQLPTGGGGQAAIGGFGSSGNFLDPTGDTMIGPIAFSPKQSFIDNSDVDNPSMDIGINSGDYSTYIQVTGDNDELRTIFGASFNGQLLYLQYTGVGELTIKQGDGTDGGNIVTNTGGDLVVNFGEVVVMLFDPTGGADPAVNGAWRVVAAEASGGGTSSRLLTGLTGDDSTVGVIPWDNNFFFGDTTKITATATPGVFKLLQGDSYTMEALLQVEMVDSGGGSDLTFIWQEAAAEGGPFTDVASNQSVTGAMEIGKATITTQPHAIALVIANTTDVFVRTFSTLLSGTYTRTIALSTIAEIETVGTGGSGTGGATSLNQLTDVNFPAVLTNDQVLTFNGTTSLWENKPFPSGGMATDLSNMSNPTIPTVPLSMNLQNVIGVNALEFDSNGAKSITTLDNIFFNQSQQSIISSANGINVKVNSNQEIVFETPIGIIAKFDEVNSTDRRLEMQGNKIQDVGKLLFSPVFNTDTSFLAQIYEESSFNNLRYVSNNAHVFVNDLGTVQMTLGDFVGDGGFIQDISEFKMLASTPSIISVDGEFQNVFQSGSSGPADVLVRSGGQTRNLSDIGAGGNEISQGNTSITIIDTGSGSITDIVDGNVVSTKSVSNFSISQSVSLGTNTLSGLGDTTPAGNHSFFLGGATLFWAIGYFDRIRFENTNNEIIGNSLGLSSNVATGDRHEFEVGLTPQLTISQNEIDFHGNNLVNVDNITFGGSTGDLDMAQSDIINVTDLTVLDDLQVGDAALVSGQLTVNASTIMNGTAIMNGNLDHNGSNIGFFGQQTTIRRVVSNPSSTSNNDLFTALNDLINALGTINGFGVGLIDTQN